MTMTGMQVTCKPCLTTVVQPGLAGQEGFLRITLNRAFQLAVVAPKSDSSSLVNGPKDGFEQSRSWRISSPPMINFVEP